MDEEEYEILNAAVQATLSSLTEEQRGDVEMAVAEFTDGHRDGDLLAEDLIDAGLSASEAWEYVDLLMES